MLRGEDKYQACLQRMTMAFSKKGGRAAGGAKVKENWSKNRVYLEIM